MIKKKFSLGSNENVYLVVTILNQIIIFLTFGHFEKKVKISVEQSRVPFQALAKTIPNVNDLEGNKSGLYGRTKSPDLDENLIKLYYFANIIFSDNNSQNIDTDSFFSESGQAENREIGENMTIRNNVEHPSVRLGSFSYQTVPPPTAGPHPGTVHPPGPHPTNPGVLFY